MKGSTLTRADLAEAVHEAVGLTRQDCAQMVERTLDLVVEALGRGEEVKLSGFGVFQVRSKRARMGRDPKTSVLNSHNQVWDAPNVFVTDGSCMTSAACQNPSLTYMALTARAADYAVGELNRRSL